MTGIIPLSTAIPKAGRKLGFAEVATVVNQNKAAPESRGGLVRFGGVPEAAAGCETPNALCKTHLTPLL